MRKPRETCEFVESSASAASHKYEWQAENALPVLLLSDKPRLSKAAMKFYGYLLMNGHASRCRVVKRHLSTKKAPALEHRSFFGISLLRLSYAYHHLSI